MIAQPSPSAVARVLDRHGAKEAHCIKATPTAQICTYKYKGYLVEAEFFWHPSVGKFLVSIVRAKKLSGAPAA